MPRVRTATLLASAALLPLLLAQTAFVSAAAESADAPDHLAAGTDSPAPIATAFEPAPLDVLEHAAPSVSDADESAEVALRALASRVTRSSHDDALRTAFRAYFNYRAANRDEVTKPFLYYVDLGLGNATPRGYVFDMDQLTVVEGPFNVAHGRGSSKTRNGVPTTFSNRPGSFASSLGIYLAQETYTFTGKSGGARYSSVGLRMRGESGAFNSAARARGIVAHGAPYVTAREAGRSEGCPAMEQQRADRLLPMIANGGVVFIYSPNDTAWLARDPWINATAD